MVTKKRKEMSEKDAAAAAMQVLTPKQRQKLLVLWLMMSVDPNSNRINVIESMWDAKIGPFFQEAPFPADLKTRFSNTANDNSVDINASAVVLSDFVTTAPPIWGGGGVCFDMGVLLDMLTAVS